jgi:hypothetical protein
MSIPNTEAERIAAALERCAQALELLAVAYVRTNVDYCDLTLLADTHDELVRLEWLKPLHIAVD